MVGFRALYSALADWCRFPATALAGTPGEFADGLLPTGSGSDPRVSRTQDRRSVRAAHEVIRLQTNEREDLVRSHHPPHAEHCNLGVRANAAVALPLPTPQFQVLATLAMFFAFFIAALGEELGWTGYAIDPMQERWNPLQASILLGVVWAVWHMIPFAQAGRSPSWIAWQCLTLVAARVLLVWLYNNTGKSVCAAVAVTVSWGPRTLAGNKSA